MTGWVMAGEPAPKGWSDVNVRRVVRAGVVEML